MDPLLEGRIGIGSIGIAIGGGANGGIGTPLQDIRPPPTPGKGKYQGQLGVTPPKV